MNSKVCSECLKLKSIEEFQSRKASKDGLQPRCRDCVRSYNASYRSTRMQSLAEYQREYRKNNPDKIVSRNSAHYEKVRDSISLNRKTNSHIVLTKEAEYRASRIDILRRNGAIYREMHREKLLKRQAAYRLANPEKNAARASKRRATELQATPRWALREELDDFYVIARLFRMYTGQPYHVDHIVPLRSKLVCGLHCESNLQLLLGDENIQKSNRYWPDMP